MNAEQPATHLTPEQITGLREQARRDAGPFTDPRILNTPIPNGEWAAAVLGRPYAGPRSITWPERYLLHIAAQAEPTPPPAPHAAAALTRYRVEEDARRTAAAQEYGRRYGAWETAAGVLLARHGVRVEVRHNYTSRRHLDGYTQGGDHVHLLDSLTVGRLRRDAGRVLCWTPSRARDLQVFDDTDDGGPPTCLACWRILRRLTG